MSYFSAEIEVSLVPPDSFRISMRSSEGRVEEHLVSRDDMKKLSDAYRSKYDFWVGSPNVQIKTSLNDIRLRFKVTDAYSTVFSLPPQTVGIFIGQYLSVSR